MKIILEFYYFCLYRKESESLYYENYDRRIFYKFY